MAPRGRGVPVLSSLASLSGTARSLLRADFGNRRMVRAYRRAPFPLYGLPIDRPAVRRCGGYGWSSNRGVERLELRHVRVDGNDDAELCVQTTFAGGSPPLDALATKLLADAARRQATPVAESARRVASWEPIELAVDDQGRQFLMLDDGPHWVAHGAIGNHELTVTGHFVDPSELHLVEIHNLEPYLTGSLIFLRTRG